MDKPELIEGKVDWRGQTAIKNKHGGTRSSIFVLGAFTFENLATLALEVNLVTYFTQEMHFNIADSANHVTNFLGTNYMVTILAAFLADAYIGRFRVVLVSTFIEFLGLGLLAVQAHYLQLKPPLCNIFDPDASCSQVNGANAALLFVGLYLVAIRSGGMKSVLPSHGADQFDDKDPNEVTQKSSFFNWLLQALCIGGAISFSLIVWIQDHLGWDWGFTASFIAMFFAMITFASGLTSYRFYVINNKSTALPGILQVYVAALRNIKLQLPQDSNELYEINKDTEAAIQELLPHTNSFRFLDKAAIRTSESTQNPWKLCGITQVENAKILLNMLPIFCCTIIMTLCLAQLQTFSIEQGATMDLTVFKHF